MIDTPDWLPPLVLLPEYDGDWGAYVSAVYEFFRADFLLTQQPFGGQRVVVVRDPVYQDKEATFWHLVSGGEVEDDRLPDIRRCERIRWPAAIVRQEGSENIRMWRNKRGRDSRVVLALPDFSYVVILAARKRYFLLWTAYCVEQGHRRRKLEREYSDWKTASGKTDAAPEDGTDTPSTHGG